MASASIATECSLCYENFKDPRILSCGHTFCYTCLERLASIRGERTCPVCRQTWNTPVGGLKDLPKNYKVNEFVELIHKSVKCTIHDNKDICAYCAPCDALVCFTCTQTSHKNHDNILELDEADKILRKQVRDSANEYNQARELLTNKYQAVMKSIDDIDKITSDSSKRIEEAAATVCSELDSYVQLIKNAINKRKSDKINLIHNITKTEKLRLNILAQEVNRELVEVDTFLTTSDKIKTTAERYKFVHETPKLGVQYSEQVQLNDLSTLKYSCLLTASNLFHLRQDQNAITAWNVVKDRFHLKIKLNISNKGGNVCTVYCCENQLLTRTEGNLSINVCTDISKSDSQNYVINPLDTPVFDAVIASNNTVICTTVNSEQILTYSKTKLISLKPMKLAQGLSIDKTDAIIMTAGESVYFSENHGKDWQKMFSVQGLTIWKAIRITTTYPHIVWLIHRDKVNLCYLASYECHDIDKCTLIRNFKMVDCEDKPFVSNDITWDYNNTIFITDLRNNRVHIYDLSGKYEGEISVENGHFDGPQGIAFDVKSKLLYVGQNQGNVIAYENNGSKTNYHLQCSI